MVGSNIKIMKNMEKNKSIIIISLYNINLIY